MNVLVLGSGGREHAMAWKIAQSPLCGSLFCLPGNPGTAPFATNILGSLKDFSAIKSTIIERNIDLVVVGPEEPLVLGLRDFLASDPATGGVLFIGPGASGARLEGSKEFAKEFMRRHGIPTARYKSFTKENIAEAEEFIKEMQPPYVIKADGLAAGKGVVITDSSDQARKELERMISGAFGAAGECVVIEQFLSGIELSVFVLTDGKDYLLLPEAKDYKRIGDGDTGPNTGGMGAVSPLPFATPEFIDKVKRRIIEPTIEGLEQEGIDYKGFIFFGLMNCAGDPYVLEYNVRLGDPETEAVMTRIDSDFLSHLVCCAKGELKGEKIVISDACALTVVCVSGGYPGAYKKGVEISGSALACENRASDAVKIFHSGTALNGKQLVTAGGRVMAVTINEKGVFEQAILRSRFLAYDQIEKINFEGKNLRGDIGLDVLDFTGK